MSDTKIDSETKEFVQLFLPDLPDPPKPINQGAERGLRIGEMEKYELCARGLLYRMEELFEHPLA